jgi:hypothetical protein
LALFFQIVLGIRVSDYQEMVIRVSGYQFKYSWFPVVLLSTSGSPDSRFSILFFP